MDQLITNLLGSQAVTDLIIRAIEVAVLAVLTVGGYVWTHVIRRQLTEKQQALLEMLAARAVLFAEQWARNEAEKPASEQKLTQALQALSTLLLAAHLKVSSGEMRIAIESAVYTYLTQPKLVELAAGVAT